MRATSRKLDLWSTPPSRRDRVHSPLTSARRPRQHDALAGKDRAVAAFLPCCGREKLPSAGDRPAQELPFGRISREPAPSGSGRAPHSYERAHRQAQLSGAFKTCKTSCCTGPGDTRPPPTLDAAHMNPAGAKPLARGHGPAQEPPRRPPGYRLDARGIASAGCWAAGWHWHSWAAGRCVGWLDVPKGSMNHLITLNPAAWPCFACQGWVLEGNSEGSGNGGFEARERRLCGSSKVPCLS